MGVTPHSSYSMKVTVGKCISQVTCEAVQFVKYMEAVIDDTKLNGLLIKLLLRVMS